MGKATGVGTIVFGAIMILLGIGAYFSGEPSSQTSEGRMGIGIVIILGLAMILGGINAREKEAAKAKAQPQVVQQVPVQPVQSTEFPPPPPDMAGSVHCRFCGREIKADFAVCPFCGKSTKANCPKCGKQVEIEYSVCPYCGTSLRSP